MPTSSQAMIVLTEEGSDPRIPRRHFTTKDSISYLPIGDSKIREMSRLPALPSNSAHVGFQSSVNTKSMHGTISYDSNTNKLRWVPSNKARTPCPDPTYIKYTNDDQRLRSAELRDQPTDFSQLSEEQVERQVRLENLGFRKKLPVARNAASSISCSAATLPVINRTPAPPAQNSRTLPELFTSRKSDVKIESPIERPKPKSFLEELKESIAYDKRLFPALYMRATLPPSSPNSACFSLRNNDQYSHVEILKLIRDKTGLRPRTIRHDPVDVRAGNPEIRSRWVLDFANSDDMKAFLQTGLEMDGEKVIVKSLDEVHKMEYQAYRLKMEEERKLAERQAMSYAARKTRRSRTKQGRSRS